MEKISDYKGQLLNHCEAVYRPGDRQIAVEFLTALGLYIEDYSAEPDSDKMLGIQFEPSDRDATNNIIFLHQMSAPQAAFDEMLRTRLAADVALRDAYGQVL